MIFDTYLWRGHACLFALKGVPDNKRSGFLLQVNFCLKLLFLHQLTHNMTTDCSLFMKILSSQYLQNMLCTQIVVFVLTFRTCFVPKLFWNPKQNKNNNLCTQHVLQAFWVYNFHEQFVIKLWVSWCKNKSFWQRFTCMVYSSLTMHGLWYCTCRCTLLLM